MSARDKMIMLFLPAVGVVLLYGWLYSEQGKLLAARQALEKARVIAVTPEAVAGGRSRLAQLSQEQAKIRTERQKLELRWQALTQSRNRTPAARAEAFQRLSKLIWQGGLFTLEEAPLEGNPSIPVSLDDMFKRLAANNPTGAVNAPSSAANTVVNTQQRMWKVRFLGRYRDVTAMLESLSNETDSPIIPVSITMAEAPLETDWRSWTLLVWM
jgi:hypothetical protein